LIPKPAMAGCPCESCRKFYERGLTLGTALREAAGTVVGMPNIANRGTLRWRAGAGRRRWAWGAVAAAAAAAILVMALSLAGNRRTGAPPVAKNPPNSAGNPTRDIAAPPTQPSPGDAARAIAAIGDPIGTLKRHARAPIDRQIESLRAEAQAAGRAIASLLPIDFSAEGRER